MATLEQMKNWLRGESGTPYGAPVGSPKKKPLPKKASRPERQPHKNDLKELKSDDIKGWEHVSSPNGSYTVSMDGSDALLLFGKHNGMRVSELMATRAGRGYLTWIQGSGNFDGSLLGIVNGQIAKFIAAGGTV